MNVADVIVAAQLLFQKVLHLPLDVRTIQPRKFTQGVIYVEVYQAVARTSDPKIPFVPVIGKAAVAGMRPCELLALPAVEIPLRLSCLFQHG